MTEETLHEQFKKVEELTQIFKLQNATFDKAINELVKNVPKEHQQLVGNFQNDMKKAILLARQGKTKEAQELIKKAQDECKNYKKRV